MTEQLVYEDVDKRIYVDLDGGRTERVEWTDPHSSEALLADGWVPPATPIVAQALSFGKGGVVGTSGKAAVALRFDDDWDFVKSLGLPGELRARGLPWSAVWCSQLASNPWNDEVSYADLVEWNRYYGGEVWSHGTNHQSPWHASRKVFSANLRREIVQSKADIEANDLRVMGFALPGVPGNGYRHGSADGMDTVADYRSEAGRLLQATYGVVETDMTGYYRHLPSDLRYGLSHTTVSDGATLQQSLNLIDGAVNLGQGIELMCHSAYLDTSGRITSAQLLEILDHIVTLRDAGLVEVVTPSSLPFCDPSSTRRLDLVSNGDFAKPVPLNNFTVPGQWYSVDGTAAKVVTVDTGPGGSSTDVLRTTASSLAYQRHDHCIGRHLAGQTYMLDAQVRSTSGTPSWRLRVTNPALNFAEPLDLQGSTTTSWERVRFCFAVPPTLDLLALFFGAVGGTVEWSDVHVYVA